MRYPIAIEMGNDDAAFGVAVPDLPGVFSAGDTIDEAIANAEEAILLGLEDYAERGQAFPKASSLQVLMANPDYAGWTWAVVNVDPSQLSTKSVRVNITLPDRVLGSIDAYAKAHGETRSGFLARAAMEVMAA